MSTDAILTNAPRAGAARAPASRPISFRTVPTAFLIVYSLLLALAVGLGSTYFILKGDPPFGSLTLGPWKAWPALGSTSADPYMRAILARRGDVPLAIGEGLGFTATTDSDGRALDSACTYRVGADTPAARLWTFSVYDQNGRLLQTELGRNSFTSAEVLRDGQGRFTITLSRSLQDGNWLQLPPSGGFSMALRLYDTPGAAGTGLTESSFPVIERVECGS
ncbi:DUF1214 domain-containing protein [Microvirga makkahensis]|uniref:DUF1214 domain-containing protein n=1 Tax=Microvirga makkahensis TaxID=1128670 RepID=A0A7X3MWH4_9HYPH|nr:DUF1214 domain-containing protein [Microvirga makkahensis]MXQ14484.1 DUF1214 domain-containing protein [Microvirga makkahensis]